MKKILISTALASLVSTSAFAYGVDANTFNASVVMASAITYSVQPGSISVASLIPVVGATGTTVFTVDGDNEETLICTLSQQDLSGTELTLFKDSDKSTNPTDTLVADLDTTCNDGTSSTITLTITSDDTDNDDIGKTYGTDTGQPVTLNVAYQ